jgi:signal transduction histidine kinase/ActR/RegA family two-component response regulator
MKLRTQISLLLFLFGLVPLLAGIVINVPMIFDRIEILYHKAHLQNLRAGFNDLDQHIARRHEMARLLAKLPEPGMLLSDSEPAQGLEAARSAYIDWVNQVLIDQLDITQVLFLDGEGRQRFWLDRNRKNGRLEVRDDIRDGLNPELVETARTLNPGVVVTGPIVIERESGETPPGRYMQLSLISPVVIPIVAAESGEVIEQRGTVIVYLDMSGLASAYRGNYWVQNDGSYLGLGDGESSPSTAFEDFAGLEELFHKGELALWEYQGQQVMWVPLFYVEGSGPLWVGRSVDPSPLANLRHAVQVRVAIIAVGLLLVVFVVARLIAVRSERLGRELTDGISRVLESDELVSFSWQRPEELHALGNNLTRLARTHSEHSRALREYAAELEASNRYKSEFLANVSHELRTPLNSILLLSKMLSESSAEKLSQEESRQARVIHDAGTDLKALIDNILDLSRIEARQMTLVPEQVELRRLLDNVLELLKPQLDEKHLDLQLEIAADAPQTIVSDSEKIRQILINFLSNAVKFTATGGITVRLGSGADQQGRYYPVAVSVTDTGIGIPAEKRGLVFEAFKQADGSTSRRYGGTGLGLTISRELAWLMGGEIEVDSEPGRGSTFTLLLPLEMPAVPGDNSSSEQRSGSTAGESQQPVPVADYHGARVLLVDDDMRNLLALTPLLEQWQLEVMAAGDGREALETLQTAGEFELVFMDIMMPGMDGYEVIRQLRADARFAELPIVALTAKASDEDRRQCLQAGANDCVVKPVDPAGLKAVVDRFLAGTGQAAE